jgi:hypothetical protein
VPVPTPSKGSPCFVTLSHRSDIERCELLVRSMDRHVAPGTPHYLVVDRRDRSRFKHFNRGTRTVLCVEDILPRWVFRLPFVPAVWFSLKTRPFRNWILQQLVKLSIPTKVREDVLIYVDTDVAFIRAFDPHSFVREGKVRLFRIPGAHREPQVEWHRTAGRLLGLPPSDYYGASYVGDLISWIGGNVVKLHEHIERVTGRHWLRATCTQWQMAEYLLYGTFVDHILGEEASGHYYDPTCICFGYWDWRAMSEDEVRQWLAGAGLQHVAIMVASYSKTPLRNYGRLIGLD